MTNTGSQRGIFLLALALIFVGLAASAYLTALDLRIMWAGGGTVESFCLFSTRFDCITVASSKYSLVFGIPIAVYGIEYFLAILGLLIVSRTSGVIRAWQSLLFWLTASSLPVIVALDYISFALIGSLCLVCLIVHGCNLLLLLALLVTNRAKLGQLAAEGPREVISVLKSRGSTRIILLILAALTLSQFYWAPRFFKDLGGKSQSWRGLPSVGLTIGQPKAPLQIEEFTDYQCPFCDKANKALMEAAAKNPESIFIRHRDYPMDMACNSNITRPFHRQACDAARAARCAARQGKFWPMDEQLFDNRKSLDEETIKRVAVSLSLNQDEFDRCLSDPAILSEIQDDIREGAARGVTGTPTFFVNGEKIVGFRPATFWEEKLAKIRGESESEN